MKLPSEIFRVLEWVTIIMLIILVLWLTPSHHLTPRKQLATLNSVINKMKANKLKLNPDKIEVFQIRKKLHLRTEVKPVQTWIAETRSTHGNYPCLGYSLLCLLHKTTVISAKLFPEGFRNCQLIQNVVVWQLTGRCYWDCKTSIETFLLVSRHLLGIN